ncbi:alcohol dehydrogenase catalytic domain-containing protein [Gallibacterium anatis]|uniref:Alcohol dehydrogenase catalytic domain-containing protein n=1 Tax=Gallibacterium anatis TaxID=750 RepID=A0A930UTE8_9PAST|nr:alcohol dehydrogenase catalytic domain-containing protein [Gallibacterium anatis]
MRRICGSDIGIYTGGNSLAKYPAIIGHEDRY